MKYSLLFFILTWLTVFDVCSGTSYMIRHLGMRQGLSNNDVVDITQDKRGFLWFATEEGLNRFDGTRFISYYKKSNGGLTGNELNCLLDDPVDSLLWIGTQRAGLNVYDYAHDCFYHYRHDSSDSHSLVTDDITDIAVAQNGNIWVSTYWNGVDLLDKKTGKFVHYNTSTVPELVSNKVWSVLDDGNGTLYIGHVHDGFTILSLKELTAKNFKNNPLNSNSLPGNGVNCVYKDRSGNIWLGTDKGLALFNPQTEAFIRFGDKEAKMRHNISDIRQFDDNRLWIAMEFGGIAILDLSQQMFVSPENFSIQILEAGDDLYSLSNSSVRCLHQDSFGNVWAGVWGGNINFVSNEKSLFNIYSYSTLQDSEKALSNPIAISVCHDRKGQMWVGTNGGGLNVFKDGKRMAVLKNTTGDYRTNIVQTSLCDSEGNLWFGLFGGGVNIYDERTNRFRQLFPKDKQNVDVRSIYEDDDRVIWLSTSEGIYKVDGEKQTILAHYDMGYSLVRDVWKDEKDNLWIGTFGGGLYICDASMKEIKHFDVFGGFPSNTINQIYADRKKRVWVATGEGLVCFPSGNWNDYHVYHREKGLSNIHIRAIAEDFSGNIWVSTNHGISCLLENKGHFQNYNEIDQVPLGSFNNKSVSTDHNGLIYFGSTDGLCSFSPEYVLSHRDAPKPIVSRVKISEPLERQNATELELFPKEGEKIRLKYTQNNLILSFNVLNYALAGQVEYACMLDGFESSWYTVDDPNNVVYRSLPPGKYTLFVKTRIRNQEWSDVQASLSVVIEPPFWLSWWAKLIYITLAVLLFGVALWLYRRRLNFYYLYEAEKRNHEHEQVLNQERLRFYTNITHELRTPLTLILGPLEDLMASRGLPPRHRQKVTVIHQSAIRLLNLINQLLEFRKTETQNKKLCVMHGNLAALVHEIGLKYKELNRKEEVRISVATKSDDMQLFFDKEIITIILDNLISNALKYTERGEVLLSLKWITVGERKYAEIRVKDTGYGISPEALPYIFERFYQEGSEHQASGTGIGLALVKNLIDLHEAQISVESTLNEGSTFIVRLQADYVYPSALHEDAAEPVKVQEKAGTETASEEPDSENNRRIALVVEDNPDICDYIAESLSDEFEVQKAENGKIGLQLAIKLVPDIIVSDVMMPEMDGVEMCRKVKENICTSHIPVILLTAKDSLTAKEEGYQTGADSYMTKPFSASLLRTRIQNLLETRRRLAEHLAGKSTMDVKKTEVAANTNKLDDEFLQKLTQIIEENLSLEKVDVLFLSEKLCMSSSTLYRKVKALTGYSTSEYVRKVKMRCAEELLLKGEYTVKQIAFMVGMNSRVYFRQCFRDEFGISPTDYMKQLKGVNIEEDEKEDHDTSQSE